METYEWDLGQTTFIIIKYQYNGYINKYYFYCFEKYCLRCIKKLCFLMTEKISVR